MKTRLTLIVATVVMQLLGANAQEFLTNGLVAHYPFNGNANDESGNGHDGTVNGATWTADGVLGGSYSFDGIDDYIRIADHIDLNPPAYTLTHWVKLSAPTIIRGSVSKSFAFTPWASQTLFLPDSRLEFHLRVNGDNSGSLFTPFNPHFNEWTMVTYMYDGFSTQMFFNDQLVAQTNFAGGQFSSPADFLIGTGGHNNDGVTPRHLFQGQIDEMRFYNRTLSPNEVSELYFLEAPPQISIGVSQVRLCWPVATGKTYQLQYRSESTTNIWVDLGSPVAGTGTNFCTTDNVTGPQKFYRLQISE